MSTSAFHAALLRTPVIQILRAAGFHSSKATVLDTLTDLTARYLQQLVLHASFYAQHNHPEILIPDVADVRLAMIEMGTLRPQLSAMEDDWRGEEDMRGIENFVAWAMGDGAKEIRRVAGMVRTEGEVIDVDGLEGSEDFLAALKKKHSKTGEEARFQGTVLGKPTEGREVLIEGGEFESIQAWEASVRKRVHREASESPLTSPDTVMATPTDQGSTPGA